MTWGTSSAGHVSSNNLILVYCLLGVSGAIFILLKTITVSITGLNAGQKYFTQMLQSSDQEVIDTQMQFSLNNLTNDVIAMLGVLALMS